MWWIILVVLGVVFGPHLLITAAGYLIQKFKFGNSFREVYEYHKEQDKLEREQRRG